MQETMTGWKTAPIGFEIREEKRNRGLACVQSSADQWATRGRSAVRDDDVLIALVRVLASPERRRPLQLRGSVASGDTPDLPVAPLEDNRNDHLDLKGVMLLLWPELVPSEVGNLADSLSSVLRQAADEWSLGDPERPATRDVFLQLARLLDECGLVPWWGESPGARP